MAAEIGNRQKGEEGSHGVTMLGMRKIFKLTYSPYIPAKVKILERRIRGYLEGKYLGIENIPISCMERSRQPLTFCKPRISSSSSTHPRLVLGPRAGHLLLLTRGLAEPRPVSELPRGTKRVNHRRGGLFSGGLSGGCVRAGAVR